VLFANIEGINFYNTWLYKYGNPLPNQLCKTGAKKNAPTEPTLNNRFGFIFSYFSINY